MYRNYLTQIIYSMLRDRGQPITLKKVSEVKFNSLTGRTDRVTTIETVRRAVVVEQDILSSFGQQIQEKYGGYFSVVNLLVYVRASDLNNEYGKNDFIVVNDREYIIEDYSKINQNKAIIFALKAVGKA